MEIDTSHRSPNQGSRGDRPISMIVLHATAGSARGALAWLTNPAARVSAHYLITKAGRVYQLVPDAACAWHAGRCEWLGETKINEMSLGIELENANNGRDRYPAAQLDALVELTLIKVRQYGIGLDMIVRHAEVARPVGRKSDPAGFPWAAYVQRIGGSLRDSAAATPQRPDGDATGALALATAISREAYRQAGARNWPGWAMGRYAREHNLGLPVAPALDMPYERRNYAIQSFGRDTLISPVGHWQTIERLSQLERGEFRQAIIEAIYRHIGEPYRDDWVFHQFASDPQLGPPLGGSVRFSADGQQFAAAVHALDVIYAPMGSWNPIARLSELRQRTAGSAPTPIERTLLQAWFRRAGSVFRPTWPPQHYALREGLGAPLGPSFRISHDGVDYVAEAFALDTVYCEIGDWENVGRLSALTAA
jgi:N-acetyl-anhydromuramyl-L-alanine amidase AmpD